MVFFLLSKLARLWRKTLQTVIDGRKKIGLKADKSIIYPPKLISLHRYLYLYVNNP
jgi:hypothetical protein